MATPTTSTPVHSEEAPDEVIPNLTLREKYPEVYRSTESPQIDYRTRKRTVPMKVLALGMPRTATASLHAALRHLGYLETHHMLSIFANPHDCPAWTALARSKLLRISPPPTLATSPLPTLATSPSPSPSLTTSPPPTLSEWDALLGNCQATCDLPSIAFAAELLAAYPSALVVLNTRPVDAWYASCLSTIHAVQASRLTAVLRYTDPAFFGLFKPMVDALWALMFDGDFEKNGKEAYARHYAMVRELVPPERLLEFEPGMGWGPLCAFLGKDVPVGVEYPRVNDREAFGERFRVMVLRGVGRSLWNGGVVVGGLAGVGWVGWRVWRWWRG